MILIADKFIYADLLLLLTNSVLLRDSFNVVRQFLLGIN
jgi:hypothetical protein